MTEATATPARAALREALIAEINEYAHTIQEFERSLDQHPLVALEWGDSALEAYARREVYHEVKITLDARGPLAADELIRAQARQREYPATEARPLAAAIKEQVRTAWIQLALSLDSPTAEGIARHVIEAVSEAVRLDQA
jgi:hypothetical protein